MAPLITGVVVILVLSISPLRSVNGLLCLGVSLGGFVAGILQARAEGEMLETTRGLLLGARVGVIAALVVIVFDLLVPLIPVEEGRLAGIDYLDPIPKYIYAAIYGIYDGLLHVVNRVDTADGLEMPGRVGRYAILLMTTFLFGGFGGGVAASLYHSPSLAQQPQSGARTPVVAGHVRVSRGPAILVNPAREAVIYQPDSVPVAPAATGTYGPDPRYPAAPAYFDQAAQAQGERRPRVPLSVDPPDASESVVNREALDA